MVHNTKIVYSTSPKFVDSTNENEINTIKPHDQQLRIWLQRLSGGRVVTIIKGFVGEQTELAKLGKMLKVACGTGGSIKNGEILIQGDHRRKILNILLTNGYKAKTSGG